MIYVLLNWGNFSGGICYQAAMEKMVLKSKIGLPCALVFFLFLWCTGNGTFCLPVAKTDLPPKSLINSTLPLENPFNLKIPLALNPSWAIADFDGDQIPDIAVGTHTGSRFGIDIHLSSLGGNFHLEPISFQSGVQIFALDIDNDNFPDIVATLPANRHPLAVWLGNGKGNFRRVDQTCYDNPLEGNSACQRNNIAPLVDPIIFNNGSRFSIMETGTRNHRPLFRTNEFICTSGIFHLGLNAQTLPLLRSPPAYTGIERHLFIYIINS
jgi:hypothetical protein